MAEVGVLFSPMMVRALAASEKTVTRRLAKPTKRCARCDDVGELHVHTREGITIRPCPRCHGLAPREFVTPLDTVWVREAWAIPPAWTDWRMAPTDVRVSYAATESTPTGWRRRNARYMPRRFSRIELRVMDVRRERLHAIDEEDARREGVAHWWASLPHDASKEPGHLWTDIAVGRGWGKTAPDYRGAFGALWSTLHGRDSWEANPEVVRVEFDVVRCTVTL